MNQHARVETKTISFIDVAAQRRRLGRAVDEAVARVLAHCQFIQGPEVRALEADLAAFCGARHAIGCSSGTDALLLVLMAWGIGPGDAVICPAFTFCATAEVVARVGATPVMADVEADTFNIDPASCERAVATAKRLGLRPKAMIPVDLFGLPADHDALAALARTHGLLILDDAAQAFGATYRGRKLGALATATATSFFPAKPLGCYGDGGAVFTDDDDLAARLKSVRVQPVKIATGAAVKTMLQISTPSSVAARIVEWGCSFDTPASASIINVELFGTTVGATSGTAITPTEYGKLSAVPSLTTCIWAPSTEGTVANYRPMDLQTVVPPAQYVKQVPARSRATDQPIHVCPDQGHSQRHMQHLLLHNLGGVAHLIPECPLLREVADGGSNLILAG